jgi:hypothetical protein
MPGLAKSLSKRLSARIAKSLSDDKALQLLLFGVRDFSATASYQTQAGGGEAGVSTGFGLVALLSVDSFNASANRYFYGRSDVSVTQGWLLHVSTTNQIRFYIVNGSSVAAPSQPYQLSSTDLGKVLIVVGWLDATGKPRVMVSAVEQATASAASGYTPRAAAAMSFSGVSGAHATAFAHGVTAYGLTTFRGTPSEAQLRAATALARTTADVPNVIEGATITHRHSVRATVAAQNPAHGAAGPATIADTATQATVDAATKIGAPTIAVINPNTTPRVWSYETAAFMRGATGFAPTDRYERASGYGGHAGGFYFRALVRVPSFAITSRVRSVCGNFNGTSGFLLYNYGTNNTFQAVFANGAGTAVAAPSAVLSASDLGKLLTVWGVCDVAASRARFCMRRAEISTGANMVGYTPRVGGTLCLGEGGYGTVADGYTLLGFEFGDGVPSLATMQANDDACLAAEDIVPLSIASSWFSFTKDGGAPSTLVDRKGSAHMARSGSGLIAASDVNSRSWGW